jgi:NlpC/P60 family putative phage cell wall peptidase
MSLARAAIVATARRWIGTPYLHQASLCHIGCDCLGLVRGVWRDLIGEEPEIAPPYSPAWAATLGGELLLDGMTRHFTPVSLSEFRTGDVLAFRFRDHLPAAHLAIVTTPEHIIHSHNGAGVTEVALGVHWRRRLVVSFGFPGVID